VEDELREGPVEHAVVERECLRRTDTDVRPGDVLILATDGVEAAFADSIDISGSAQDISERILAVHGKPIDDALVLAVRYIGVSR